MKPAISTGTIVKYVVAAFAMASCAQGLAQGKVERKRLDSFCGFKAGESRQEIRKSVKTEQHTVFMDGVVTDTSSIDWARAKTPFRKFKDVELYFSPEDKLVGVCAYAYLKISVGPMKNELDECSKLLAKYNGMEGLGLATKESLVDKLGFYYNSWTAKGTTITVRSNPYSRAAGRSGKMEDSTRLEITVKWDFDKFHKEMLSVKPGQYVPSKGISRRQFVEETFGVKFGDNISKHVKLDKADKSQQDGANKVIVRDFAEPVFGFGAVDFICNPSWQLEGIRLIEPIDSPLINMNMAKATGIAKTRIKKLRTDLEKWLRIKMSEPKGKDGGEMFASLEGEDITVSAKAEYEYDSGSKVGRFIENEVFIMLKK